MLFDLETVALTKGKEAEMEVELMMLTFSLGVKRMDRIRNKTIRGPTQVGHFEYTVREASLIWFGDV